MLACTIIGLVAVKLQSITVNTADIIDDTFTNVCLLGAVRFAAAAAAVGGCEEGTRRL